MAWPQRLVLGPDPRGKFGAGEGEPAARSDMRNAEKPVFLISFANFLLFLQQIY